MRVRLILLAFALLGFAAIPCAGQDAGVPDTVRFTPSTPTWIIEDPGDTLFLLHLYAWTDQSNIMAAVLPFMATTCPGSVPCDDDSQFAADTFQFQPFEPNVALIANISALNTSEIPYAIWNDFNGCLVGLVVVGSVDQPLLEANTVKHVGDLRLKVFDPTLMPQEFEIDIDTTFFPPTNHLTFSRPGGNGFPPQFVKATVAVNNILGMPEPATIVLEPPSFDLDAVQGWNPASFVALRPWEIVNAELSISNSGSGTLDWTARDDAGWLSLNPKSGIGDGSTTLSVDTYGLVLGTYSATISVSDPNADNSPQTIQVTLDVVPPPPPKYAVSGPTYMYYMYAYNPRHAAITTGVADTIASASVNGVPAAIVSQGGGMATLELPIAPFLVGYGAPVGTIQTTFSVEGTYDDASTFSFFGELTLKGKNPANPKSWLVPQDDIVLYGDADATGSIDIDDAVTLISYIFMGEFLPGPSLMGDCNCSVFTDIDDVVYLIGYIFQGGPFPCQAN